MDGTRILRKRRGPAALPQAPTDLMYGVVGHIRCQGYHAEGTRPRERFDGVDTR